MLSTTRLGTFVTVLLIALAGKSPAEEPRPILLWPEGAPGEEGQEDVERQLPMKAGDPTVRVTGVSRPAITVFQPAAEKNTGAAVVICPGGGYGALAYNKEGTDVAEWLNTLGVTGIVLKYRVPARKGQERYAVPLQDAQRAMGLVRERAKEWNIEPDRIGLLGFSAGGHLTAVLNSNDKRTYPATDASDKVSCQPNFTLLIYPAYLALADQDNQLAPELKVTSAAPPTFLVQTQDDSVRVECSVFYYLALKRAKVPAEMHLYPAGGHGYGLRPSPHPVSAWPQRAEAWLRGLGVLERK